MLNGKKVCNYDHEEKYFYFCSKHEYFVDDEEIIMEASDLCCSDKWKIYEEPKKWKPVVDKVVFENEEPLRGITCLEYRFEYGSFTLNRLNAGKYRITIEVEE